MVSFSLVMNVKCWACLASFDWLNRTWFLVELRDWAAEHDYPQALREMAQAHSVGDSVAPAYRHSTRLNKKRDMMRMVNGCARKLLVRIGLCVGSLLGIEFLDVWS
jgi:hypothetical protein